MVQSHEEGTDLSFFFHVFTWVRISLSKVTPHFQFVLSEFSAARAERHQYGMVIYVKDHPHRVIPICSAKPDQKENHHKFSEMLAHRGKGHRCVMSRDTMRTSVYLCFCWACWPSSPLGNLWRSWPQNSSVHLTQWVCDLRNPQFFDFL